MIIKFFNPILIKNYITLLSKLSMQHPPLFRLVNQKGTMHVRQPEDYGFDSVLQFQRLINICLLEKNEIQV